MENIYQVIQILALWSMYWELVTEAPVRLEVRCKYNEKSQIKCRGVENITLESISPPKQRLTRVLIYSAKIAGPLLCKLAKRDGKSYMAADGVTITLRTNIGQDQ
jgi:hypothetical protein